MGNQRFKYEVTLPVFVPRRLQMFGVVLAEVQSADVLGPSRLEFLCTPHIHLAVDEVSDLVDSALVYHGLHLKFLMTYSNDSVPLLPMP